MKKVLNSVGFWIALVLVFVASIPVIECSAYSHHEHGEVTATHTYYDDGKFFVQKNYSCGHETVKIAHSKINF